MNKVNILVTGGAGFIGSNLVEVLLSDDRVQKVRVLDNLSTGFKENLASLEDNPKLEFILGDIRDYATCLQACQGMDLVSHQAALGSVPRSIKSPLDSNAVNITGTLNVFTASKEKNVKRVVFAASSSTYGDNQILPKVEENIGNPLSPYAVTKYVNELYADVYAKTYDNFEYLGLRYFNVFGPKQDPNGTYAAVIPIFMKCAFESTPPTINGDGSFSRDFTYIENVIQANLEALFTSNKEAINQVYNIAYGERTTLNELWNYINNVVQSDVKAKYGPNRIGDIPHSLADISKAKKLLGYNPQFNVLQGIQSYYQWFKENL